MLKLERSGKREERRVPGALVEVMDISAVRSREMAKRNGLVEVNMWKTERSGKREEKYVLGALVEVIDISAVRS